MSDSQSADQSAGYYLVLNAGSSSVKFAGYAAGTLECLFQGQIDDKGGQAKGSAVLKAEQGGRKTEQPLDLSRYDAGFLPVAPVLEWLESAGPKASLLAVGHRVVHGGEAFQAPVIVNAEVTAAIESCRRFAPLHNPANLQGIADCQSRYPELPQVAVFDTAFHQTLDADHYLYALPHEWYENLGVRRYGFHGTSHEYVYQEAEKRLGLTAKSGAFITLHLGNGCSAAAIEKGRSLDTTMGLTPLEGMMMGTRCGDIDPGLPEYLCQQLDCSIVDLTRQLNKQSGLLGVSGLTSDMRQLQQAMDEDHQGAERAFNMFCLRAARAAASMRVSLGSLDALIFTGGIGEHSARVRQRILSHLRWMTAATDDGLNNDHGRQSSGVITQRGTNPSSACAMVVPTDEELMIATHIQQLLQP